MNQVESSEENTPFTVSVQDIPGQEPSHVVTIRNIFYIDQSDFRLGADKGSCQTIFFICVDYIFISVSFTEFL